MSGKKSASEASIVGSPLNELNKKILEAGESVIRLHVGEPHVTTPLFMKEAAAEALEVEFNNAYTLVEGDRQVRESICTFVRMMFGLEYLSEEVVFTSGAKQAMDLSVVAILADKTKRGKEIIISASDWPTYDAIIRANGGISVLVGPNKDFSLPLAEIKEAITADTRAIIINSPNNPTSAVYGYEELEQLALLAIEHDFLVISDEVYRAITLEGEMPASIASFHGMKERTFVVNSFSKIWAIPGWRAGFVLARKDKCKVMDAAKSNIDGSTCSLIQFIIKAVIDNHFEGSLTFIKECNEGYRIKRNYICRLFDRWGVEYVRPKGAFYIFAKLPEKFGVKSKECSEILLRAGIAVAPGIIFGEACDDYVRICFANTIGEINKAMSVIENLLIKGVWLKLNKKS